MCKQVLKGGLLWDAQSRGSFHDAGDGCGEVIRAVNDRQLVFFFAEMISSQG